MSLGPIGRAGLWMADHRRAVFSGWAALLLLAAVFAPRVEHALSGAGWEASGSESVAVRDAIDADFGGQSSYAIQVVVHSDAATIGSRGFDATVRRAEAVLAGDDAISDVVPPSRAATISADGHTAVIGAGAARDPNEMVAAATDLRPALAAAAGPGIEVELTGAAGMWSDFNSANKEAMLKSELISWPVTLAILVVAFGSLVAAGLPLLLTISGLLAAAGSLWAAAQILDVSIWAMNFALMFALALGIDYALFIVHRFRGALFGAGLEPREATGVAMDTAGKAVLFSGLTVLISLSAVMLVPSPAFRSMSLGIMLAVIFVLAASMTLLPALLARLGPRVDRLALPWVHGGEHRSARFARWGERLWRRPLAYGAVAIVALAGLAIPVLRLDTGMPSIKVVPTDDSSRIGYGLIQEAFGAGAPGTMQVIAPASRVAATERALGADPGIARALPAQPAADGERALIAAVPTDDPSSAAAGATIERLRAELPPGVMVGGAAVENHDLEATLRDRAPLVIGVVLALGFVLLLVALQAPLIAAAGVLTNLLATGAAFGVATWLFQDGVLSGPLGFESQGFLDAWAPVFFFAMIFAISMDYTVFLLSSAREHWERSGDPREAMIGGVAHSGRVIFAAAAVMVAVFFTFALSGPLPPKEMGLILGIAVLLDALLVRLLLVPVLLRLLGRAAWALPRPLARVLPDVSFGHGPERPPAGAGVE